MTFDPEGAVWVVHADLVFGPHDSLSEVRMCNTRVCNLVNVSEVLNVSEVRMCECL